MFCCFAWIDGISIGSTSCLCSVRRFLSECSGLYPECRGLNIFFACLKMVCSRIEWRMRKYSLLVWDIAIGESCFYHYHFFQSICSWWTYFSSFPCYYNFLNLFIRILSLFGLAQSEIIIILNLHSNIFNPQNFQIFWNYAWSILRVTEWCLRMIKEYGRETNFIVW